MEAVAAVEDGGADGEDGAGRWFQGGKDDSLGVGEGGAPPPLYETIVS